MIMTKNSNTRKKKMKREARMSSGRHWLKQYEGKKPIRSYIKRYGVSRLCALIELKQLGLTISEDEIETEKRVEKNKARKKAALAREQEEECVNCDANFSFIIGYTSGGAPYGTTWEETEASEEYPTQ